MKFTKKELLIRGPVLLVGVLALGYWTINLNVGLLLAMVLGGATWEVILFALFRYGIITWRRDKREAISERNKNVHIHR